MNTSDNQYNGIFRFPGNWDFQAKLLLKKNFAQLRLADLKLVIGRENELLDRIGIRLDKNRDQVVQLLRSLRLG
jgi:hypothetical protein